MTWGLIKAIIILPGTVLVFVPTVILIVSRGTRFSYDFRSDTHAFGRNRSIQFMAAFPVDDSFFGRKNALSPFYRGKRTEAEVRRAIFGVHGPGAPVDTPLQCGVGVKA